MVAGNGFSVVQTKGIADLFVGGFRFTDGPRAYRKFSHDLTDFFGRPVVVVNLADLPHAYKNPCDIPPEGTPAFTPQQIADRQARLSVLVKASLSRKQKRIVRGFELAKTVGFASPVTDTLSSKMSVDGKDRHLLDRLNGDYWNRAAIILMPDRNWSEKAKWSFLTGLKEEDISAHPAGDGLNILTFFHEFMHVEQRFENFLNNTAAIINGNTGGRIVFDMNDAALVVAHKERKWIYELDADKGADDLAASVGQDARLPYMTRQSLMEARAAMPMVRAISRFLMSPEYYGTGLALLMHQQGQAPLSFSRHCEAHDEISLRCLERDQGTLSVNGELLSRISDSAIIHNTTNAYRLSNLSSMRLLDIVTDACDSPKPPESRLKMLQTLAEVTRDEPITDSLTRQTAELVLQAARFFCPAVLKNDRLMLPGEEGPTRLPVTGRFSQAESSFALHAG